MALTLTLDRSDLLLTRNFIGGRWIAAQQELRYRVDDPASDALITEVADSGVDDARAAADAAHAAFPAWRALPARQRSQLLRRWHSLILAHAQDLARLMSREQGKPLAAGMMSP